MKIEVIPAGLLTTEHVSDWNKIQQSNQTLGNPSFSPEFTQAIDSVRNDVQVAILRDNNVTVGFFPFQKEQKVGLPVGSVLTDMHGLIINENRSWKPMNLMKGCGLHAWQFDHLLASQKQFSPHVKCVEPSPFMDTSQGYDTYFTDRKKNGGSSIKRVPSKARKLEREVGPLTFHMHDEKTGLLETIIRWKQQQIAAQDANDIYKNSWVVEAVKKVSETQTSEFSGMITTLYAGDNLVAALVGMRTSKVISSWIPTINPEFHKYSPGMILHLELAKVAAEQGVQRIDLGRGMNQMKTTLGSDSIPLALGAVDSRPLNRFIRNCWYKTREVIYNTPLNGFSLRYYRKVRNWLT